MQKILLPSFFNRPTLEVAQDLLGKYLIRRLDGQNIALMVTEVEAYDGFDDKASHACRGKTARNDVMFGSAGYIYMYLIYGMYWMLNIVTGPQKYPAAVLIRGVGDLAGPGRLTRVLQLDRSFHKKIARPESGLWFEERGVVLKQKEIVKVPRIGVAYAGPIWSKKPYRFLINRQQDFVINR